MQAFNDWLEKPLGNRLIQLETAKINALVPTLFGYDAAILGEGKFVPCLDACTITRKTQVGPVISTTPGIQSRYDKLPLATEILDLAYLAHSLEFSNNPHEVLREVYRALRPDGHIIITMFNPMSSWGVLSKFWKANFISLAKLKDWLALLGFDIMRVNHFGFMLPIQRSGYPEKMSKFEKYGQRFELPMGGAYVVQAAKRIIPLTPIEINWQKETQVEEDDVTEPTT